MHNAKQTNKPTNHTMKLDPSLAKLLSADADKIQAPALKAAAEKLRKQQEEKDAETALRALKHLQLQTESHVNAVREIRKREKSMIETLRGITAAKEKFMKDGDVEALNKTLISLRVSQVFM